MNIFKSIWEAIFGKKRGDRDYYDRSKSNASRWKSPALLIYRHSGVDDRLWRLYTLALTEWSPVMSECGVQWISTDKIEGADIILRGWTDFVKGSQNQFGYTQLLNYPEVYPGIRTRAEIMLNTLRQNEDDDTVYKVILHELGHAFAWDGESGQSISDNRDDIMHSPTYAKHLSDADKRSMRKAYGK